MAIGNLAYLSSPSGMFRLLTVILGFPSLVLVWIAYFSSSWTKTFPEIIAIIIVEKNFNFDSSSVKNDYDNGEISIGESETTSSTTTKTPNESSSSEDYDLISDKEEEYLDEILLQTLIYEKFFIGIVTIVFVISLGYLILRVVSKHTPDSPYEIIIDFIYHVLAALGLLTGSALVFLSAAKIQSFVDQVINDEDEQEIISNIIKKNGDVQDKADKIAAAAIGMINGILYALCVVTLRMTSPTNIATKLCSRKKKPSKKHLSWRNSIETSGLPRFSVISVESQGSNTAPYGFYGNYS